MLKLLLPQFLLLLPGLEAQLGPSSARHGPVAAPDVWIAHGHRAEVNLALSLLSWLHAAGRHLGTRGP